MSDLFEFGGKVYPYCSGDYNSARRNERAVEVPLAQELLLEVGPADTLEVGAVLPHYMPRLHTVVDLHEQFPGVINADVLEWEPSRKYDAVISISTLEHLHTADEFERAVGRLRDWTAPGGIVMVTVPYGPPENDWLDVSDLARKNTLEADEIVRFDKVDIAWHTWRQVSLATPWLDYNGASKWANSVIILTWDGD